MHDYIRMGYLGLEDREVRVLKSIFTLSPHLKEHYVLTGSSELKKADLVLVNADSPRAVEHWSKVARVNKLATPLTFSAIGKTVGDIVPLKLPIRLSRLIEALEEVVREITHLKVPESTSGNEAPLRVLIVDDSYPVRKYMEQKIADIAEVPIQLSFSASGEEALVKCKGREYDIVFLDVMMEGIDGYKVCKTIKSRYTMYVVMLTSKKSPFDRVRGTMSGCDAYITKPPTDQRLIEEIEKSIEFRARKRSMSLKLNRVSNI